MGFFTDLIETFQSFIITIPVDNLFGAAYVVLNLFVSLFALLTYGGGDGLGGGGTLP